MAMARRAVGLAFASCVYGALGFGYATSSLSVELPIRVALLLPGEAQGKAELINPTELRALLGGLSTHTVAFTEPGPLRGLVESDVVNMSYALNWQVSELSGQDLVGLEAELARAVADGAEGEKDEEGAEGGEAGEAAAAGGAARRTQMQSNRGFHAGGGRGGGGADGLPIPVHVADAYLRGLAERHFPGETVLFVVAPRKARVFADAAATRSEASAARQRYHYTPASSTSADAGAGAGASAASSAAPNPLHRHGHAHDRCLSAWVGSGRFMALDLSAGPCSWGSQVAGAGLTTSATLPHVGDGTQGAESLSEALGLRAYGGGGDDDGDGGEEDDEADDGELGAGGSRRRAWGEREAAAAAARAGAGAEVGAGAGAEAGGRQSVSESKLMAARRRKLLTAQVVAAAASAVRTVLAPDPDSHENPTAANGGDGGGNGDGEHARRSGLGGLASRPERVLVPIVVLMPTHHGSTDNVEARPTRRTREAEASITTADKQAADPIHSLLDLTALRRVISQSLMADPSAAVEVEVEVEVEVVAAVHAVQEHPQIRVALAQAMRSKTRYVPKSTDPNDPNGDGDGDGSNRFEVEESPYLDAEGLRDALRKAGDGFADTLLNEVGHEAGAALSLIELDLATSAGDAWFAAQESKAADGGDADGSRVLPKLASQHEHGTRVLPVFLLSDMVPDSADALGGGITFENGLLVSASSECVVALHSSSHGMVSTDHLLDSVNDELGLDPSDATSHVAAGVLSALAGLHTPGLGEGALHGHSTDVTWANGYHPFAPFSIPFPEEATPAEGASEGVVPRSRVALSPIFHDAARRTNLAAKVHAIGLEAEAAAARLAAAEGFLSDSLQDATSLADLATSAHRSTRDVLSRYPPLVAEPLGRARAALATLASLDTVRSLNPAHMRLDDAISLVDARLEEARGLGVSSERDLLASLRTFECCSVEWTLQKAEGRNTSFVLLVAFGCSAFGMWVGAQLIAIISRRNQRASRNAVQGGNRRLR